VSVWTMLNPALQLGPEATGVYITRNTSGLYRRVEYFVVFDQVSGKIRRAGAPKHRQRFLSARPGGWGRTPVNSSGTRLTLALGGGLEGPPRPAITPYPFPSASSVGVGRHRGSAWVRQFSPP
jgi:hypothetical protein